MLPIRSPLPVCPAGPPSVPVQTDPPALPKWPKARRGPGGHSGPDPGQRSVSLWFLQLQSRPWAPPVRGFRLSGLPDVLARTRGHSGPTQGARRVSLTQGRPVSNLNPSLSRNLTGSQVPGAGHGPWFSVCRALAHSPSLLPSQSPSCFAALLPLPCLVQGLLTGLLSPSLPRIPFLNRTPSPVPSSLSPVTGGLAPGFPGGLGAVDAQPEKARLVRSLEQPSLCCGLGGRRCGLRDGEG